jgi:four helix bundle protein
MDRDELEKRTKRFALDIIRLVKAFPKDKAADVIAYQLLRSGTSIGANYREATRAESKADFVHKLGMVQKEANETVYWLDLVQESEMINEEVVAPILSEAKELLAIFGASHKTAANR